MLVMLKWVTHDSCVMVCWVRALTMGLAGGLCWPLFSLSYVYGCAYKSATTSELLI